MTIEVDRTESEEVALERAAARSLENMEPDAPMEVDIAPDRTLETRTPNFSRMRTQWHGHDGPIIQSVLNVVEGRILQNFGDVYQILEDLLDIVRKPVLQGGEIVRDAHGFPEWQRTPSGRYVEDWSLLGSKERENFLFQITTRLFDWEQRAAESWGEAMFAKAMWEERYSHGFINPEGVDGRKTDATRESAGKSESQDERYFAIFQGLYSRKADALVRSMERISLRLSQTTSL